MQSGAFFIFFLLNLATDALSDHRNPGMEMMMMMFKLCSSCKSLDEVVQSFTKQQMLEWFLRLTRRFVGSSNSNIHFIQEKERKPAFGIHYPHFIVVYSSSSSDLFILKTPDSPAEIHELTSSWFAVTSNGS